MVRVTAQGGTDVTTARVENSWQVKAACRGPQAVVFFPPPHPERKDERAEREQLAKGICASCGVRKPCLDYALELREPHGIWGGLNELERKAVLSRRSGPRAR